MSRILRYITHPQIVMDPAIPVPQWQLSPEGKDRVEAMDISALGATTTIISSAETKAVETAQILSERLGLNFSQRKRMHENDRSSTGFLPPDEFEKIANAFFAEPENSISGWEKAIDAQIRIVRETQAALSKARAGDILFIGHGAVGTLLYCHFASMPIDRRHDQPNGGGNYFSVDLKIRKVCHPWKPIEEMRPGT